MGRLATSVVMALVACGVALFAPIEHPQVKQMQAEAHLKLEPVVAWAKEQYSVLETKVKAVQAGSTASRSPAPVSTSAKVFISPAADADEVAACRLSGKVAGCGCDYASVERLNRDTLHPLLNSLVQLPYFRYFKVNLYCDCQFWDDAGMCFQKDCCVRQCEDDEIPPPWRAEDQAAKEERHEEKAKDEACDGASGVDRSVDAGVQQALSKIGGWRGLNNPWVPLDDAEEAATEYVYVDLQSNPEKYTGYKGEDARRIWAAIYDQSALKEAASGGQVAREQEVLYRLISGMHSSITTSIVNNYYDEEKGTWGPNLPFFKARFASPASKPYVENLYFTMLFVLRAVTKASDVLRSMEYNTGQPQLDARTRELMSSLVASPALSAACPAPFDEALLWRHDNAAQSRELRQQLTVAFHNITRLMDCVGCEKCKMHGKLNILGIASALKVLFAQPEELDKGTQPLALERNEVIALVNLLAKLSDSVETVRALNVVLDQQAQQKQQQQGQAAGSSGKA